MIPPFGLDGNLPPGIHSATWGEVEERFGGSGRRVILLEGLYRALVSLRDAGCHVFFLDGSFVTSKDEPVDFDACWDPAGVDYRRIDPVLFDFEGGRKAQKRTYFGELFPTPFRASPDGLSILEFFQRDRLTGRPKGIVAINPREVP